MNPIRLHSQRRPSQSPTLHPRFAGLVLAIETSCDETSLALYRNGRLLDCLTASQERVHQRFGGVVPELASRAHVENLPLLLERLLERTRVGLADVELVACTRGPGLEGALLAGLSFAKGLSLALAVPLLGLHHIVAHVYGAFLGARRIPFPLIALVVSGGHTLLLLVEGHGRFELLGTTVDDAAGEALDKGARMLGLPFPGGPLLDRLAASGDARAVALPRPDPGGLNFSFSGLKTALRRVIENGSSASKADLAASFQQAVVEALVRKTEQALLQHPCRALLACGGVSANSLLRRQLALLARRLRARLLIPPPAYCTDNAAMVAACAAYLYPLYGPSSAAIEPMPRWPIERLA